MKRGLKILVVILRIYFLHTFAILAVWLGMYFPGLDIMLSILYLILLREEGKHGAQLLCDNKKQGLVALLWQLPGFFLGTSVLLEFDRLTDFAYYFIFMLELWETPILPLLSLLPTGTITDKPIYYYCLFVMVPVLSILYYLPGHNLMKKKS
jgi:hypothetical protein